MVDIPNQAGGAGIPSTWTESITAFDKALITGHKPDYFVEDKIVAASQTLLQHHVVGLDASGNVVPALWHATPASAIKPIGITTIAITTAGATAVGLGIIRGGCLNPDALVWPASFDTDAKKMNAFEGAASPTQIILRPINPGAAI